MEIKDRDLRLGLVAAGASFVNHRRQGRRGLGGGQTGRGWGALQLDQDRRRKRGCRRVKAKGKDLGQVGNEPLPIATDDEREGHDI